MNRLRTVAVLAALASVTALGQYVNDNYLDTLQSTGTSVNGSTKQALGGSGGLLPGAYTVQCDAAAYFEMVKAASDTTSSTTGTKIQADQPWPFGVPANGGSTLRAFPAVISVSGTVNCKFYRSLG